MLIMEIFDIIAKISVPILTLATIFMTCYIHKLSNENAKKENYLRHIIDLYYRIEDNLRYRKGDNIDELTVLVNNTRELKVNCTLMIYYLQRYPGFYKNRTRFILLLNEIIDHPEYETNDDNLSNAFCNLCLNIKKDSKEEAIHIYINGKECGFPEKE